MVKGQPKKKKAKKDVCTVNFNYDGLFTSCPMIYFQGEMKVLTDTNFNEMSYEHLLEIVKREIKSDQDIADMLKVGYDNNNEIDMFVDHFGYDIMKMVKWDINEEMRKNRIKAELESSDDDYDYSDDDLKQIENVDFHTKGDNSVVIKNISRQDPFLTKLCSSRVLFRGNVDSGVDRETPEVDPDDNQIDYVYKVKRGVVYPAFDPDLPWDKMEPILGMRYESPHQLRWHWQTMVLPMVTNFGTCKMTGDRSWFIMVEMLLREDVQDVAFCTLEQQFQQIMDQIKLLDANAYDYLIQTNPNSWSKAFFEMDKRCAAFENGISESFNRAILGPRQKPIITMLEEIRLYIMQRIVSMNKFAFSLEDRITPSIRKRLELLKEKQRLWELSGVPCVHVMVAYMHVGSDIDVGVSYWYSQESWFNAYQFSIKPVFRSNMWKMTNDVPPLPPTIRKIPGKPQKAKIKAPGETSGSQKHVFVRQCASRVGGRSGRGDGIDGSGSGVNDDTGSGVNDGSGSGVNDGSGSGGRGGERVSGRGKRGGGRAGRGSGRDSRGGGRVDIGGGMGGSSSFGILTAEEVVDTAITTADVEEAPTVETSDTTEVVEGKDQAVDKGKAKAIVEDEPTPKKKRGRPPSSVDGIRIYHNNRGRSERIANMKSKKPFQFDKFGSGSTLDKAFDVEE
ncbi:hypothetical protein Tco_0087605 [Tanacetum coccineum]